MSAANRRGIVFETLIIYKIIIVARKNHAFCKQTQFVAVSNLREVNLRNYIICGRLKIAQRGRAALKS